MWLGGPHMYNCNISVCGTEVDIPDHHKVASITSIFLGRHRRLLCRRMKSEKSGDWRVMSTSVRTGVIYTVLNKGCPMRNE